MPYLLPSTGGGGTSRIVGGGPAAARIAATICSRPASKPSPSGAHAAPGRQKRPLASLVPSMITATCGAQRSSRRNSRVPAYGSSLALHAVAPPCPKLRTAVFAGRWSAWKRRCSSAG
eukprot:7100378-Prymnesium_polylepis.1